MVDRVSHHVSQRVRDQIDHVPVNLRILTLDLELDDLAALAGEVPDDSRRFLKSGAERDHAH